MNYASVVIVLESEDKAKIIRKSIAVDDLKMPRSTVKLEVDKNKLKLKINTENIGALRAALNTYLGLIKVASEI